MLIWIVSRVLVRIWAGLLDLEAATTRVDLGQKLDRLVLMRYQGEQRLVTIFFFVVLVACATTMESSRWIDLAPAGQAIHVTGQLHGMHQVQVFTFFARAGTFLKVDISGAGALRGIVESPSGQTEGGPGGVILNQELTETGNYRLRVEESTMGEAWRGEFSVRIETVQ